MKAATMAGIPNLMRMGMLVYLTKSENLKRLLEKCTMAVMAIATGKGKKSAITGISKVPSPKPEKKVSSEAANATMATRSISILIKTF